MRKIAFLLIISTLIVCFAPVCYASGAEVSVGNAAGKSGSTVEVSVVLSGNIGFASLGLEIGYDSSALELVEVTANASVGATFTKSQDFSANPYYVGWDSAVNVKFNGTLATLKFKIKAESGEYPVTVSFYKGRDGNYTDGYDTNYDENFNDLNLSYKSGVVTAGKEKAFEITDFDNTSGISFKVSLPSVSGYLFAVIYDASGKMIDVRTSLAKSDNPFGFSKNGAILKVFWFDSALRPVANPLIKYL